MTPDVYRVKSTLTRIHIDVKDDELVKAGHV